MHHQYFLKKTKHLDTLMKLPMFVTSMLARGHGDIHYVYYGLDSNYTIGSFAKLP